MAVTVFGLNKHGLGEVFNGSWDKLLIVAVAFALLTFSKINPAFIILGGAMLGGVLYR
jgi:hypothetical protein